MITNNVENLLSYARQHGFEAWPCPLGGIHVAIGYVLNGSSGVDVYHVTSWNQLREVLGY